MAPDTTQDTTTQENPTIQPTRLPYDVEFLEMSAKFSDAVLVAIPELRGLAIVPMWTHPPENCRAGLMRLRNPEPPYLSELLALLGRLTSFAVDVHRDLVGQLKMFNQYASELSATISDRTNQLEQLNTNADTTDTPEPNNAEQQ